MHDAMIKKFEVFIKLKILLTHIESLIKVKSSKVKGIVLKIFYSCYSIEEFHTDLKQKELQRNKIYIYF
jgi:hypothetical protein